MDDEPTFTNHSVTFEGHTYEIDYYVIGAYIDYKRFFDCCV